MQIKYELPCNIASTLNIVGDRWTLLIVHEILTGNTTFIEIKKALPGISAKLLSNRFKRLEEEGIIYYEVYSRHPLRQQYLLTERGIDLQHILNAYVVWGQNNLKDCHKMLIDADSGEEVELGYYTKLNGQRVKDVKAIKR